MTNAQYFSGRWAVSKDDASIVNEHGKPVFWHNDRIDNQYVDADLRLAAAAPDMLLALKAVVAAADSHTAQTTSDIHKSWIGPNTKIVINRNPVISACRVIISHIEATS